MSVILCNFVSTNQYQRRHTLGYLIQTHTSGHYLTGKQRGRSPLKIVLPQKNIIVNTTPQKIY